MKTFCGYCATMILALVLTILPCQCKGGLGLAVGYSSTTIDVPRATPNDPQSESHFRIGVFGSFRHSAQIAIRPGVFIGKSSSKYSDLLSHLDGSLAIVSLLEVSTDLLEIPVLFEIRHSADSAIDLLAGFSIGVALSSEYNQEGWIEKDWATDSDFGAIVGLAYSRTSGGARIGIDLIYRHPLSHLGNKSSYIGETKVSGASVMGRVSF